MPLQPSASRTALLLACPRPFEADIEVEADAPGEPARYGSAFHQVIAACLRSSAKKPLEREIAKYAREVERAVNAYDVRGAAGELAGHVKSSVKVLRNWLEREKLSIAAIEHAYAISPQESGNVSVRAIPPHDENHHYDVEPSELPGTVDLIAVSTGSAPRTVIIDHKTGGGEHDTFAQPAAIPQMQTLGLVSSCKDTELAIFHADRQGLPAIYAEPYEPEVRKGHTKDLHTALRLIGQGFMRPGAHCGRCPARTTCPAHAADLLADSTATLVQTANTFALEPLSPTALYVSLAEAPLDAATLEVRAGALYELLEKFRKLEKAGSAEIKRLVKEGKIIETRDGKVLVLKEQSYETLSKKSVIEALGKIEGEKELARLRKKGAMRETKREMMVLEK